MADSTFSEVMAGGLLFQSSSIAASLCVYLWSRPRRLELLGTTALAGGLCLWLGLTGVWYARLMLMAMYWAIVAFCASFLLAFVQGGKARVKVVEGMMLMPALVIGTFPMLFVMSWLTPVTGDYYLYASSTSFGIPPPDFLVAQFVSGNYWLRSICELVYMNLPVGLTVIFLMLREKSPEDGDKFFRCGLWLALLGWLCYLLFPASGNIAIFKDLYPWHPPALQNVAVDQQLLIGNARNCLPSLHTAWVLIMFWFTRPLGLTVRGAALLFTALTLIYVLVCGHYFMDIFVTLPWVTAIYAWCLRGAGWQRVAGEGVAFYLLFLLYLRFGGPLYLSSAVYSWAAVGLSVAWTFWRVRGLHREAAEFRFSPAQCAPAV